MNSTQLPFLVEGILITVTIVLGFLLRKSGKPYGKLKLVGHIFFYLWFTTGFWFIASALSPAKDGLATSFLVGVMGLMILVQLATGVAMMASRTSGSPLPKIHLVAAFVLLLADVCAFFTAGSSI